MNDKGFIMSRDLLQHELGDSDVIFCHGSALDLLGLYTAYTFLGRIDVYAKEAGTKPYINYRVMTDFSGIDTVQVGSLTCTSINQTFNDMLSSYDTLESDLLLDDEALAKGLSNYYHKHGETFEGLSIDPANAGHFEKIKPWAIEFYDK